MPKILLEIPPDEFTAEEIRQKPETVWAYLHQTAKADVEDNLYDDEAYVPDSDFFSQNDCIFGAITPEMLKEAVLGWNHNIQKELMQAITNYLNDMLQKGMESKNILLIDTAATYELKKTALAADNSFYDFSERFVDLPNEHGFTYLRSVIDQQSLEAILAEPERYAIIPIWVK
ncbi:MAG: hypothetical protein RR502_08300 [Oscillospiraceae bacterium]